MCERVGDVELLLRFQLSYILCFDEFSLEDVADIVLQLANMPHNAEYIILTLLLQNGNRLTSLELLSVLLRAIESQQYIDNGLEWLLWKSLVCLLGPLIYTSRTAPLYENSDVLSMAPADACWKRGAALEKARSEEISLLREQTHQWWNSTVLSPASLGEFTWGVIEEDIPKVTQQPIDLDRIGLLSDELPPLLDLSEDINSEASSTSSTSTNRVNIAQFKAYLRAIVFQALSWRDLLCLELRFEAPEKKRFDFPHEFLKAVKHIHEEDRHIYVHLSEGLLEILAMKLVVAAHIYSADCLFACRGTQIILQHKNSTLVNYLLTRNFNVERACYIASCCYKVNISTAGVMLPKS